MATMRSASYMLNMYRPREKMKYIVQDTRDHMLDAFETQKVFPFGEVRPGWFKENEYRKQHGGSYSTGDGARSFHWQLKYTGESEDHFPATTWIQFLFNNYLGYVDYGVGKNRKVREIKRSKPAVRGQRYASWDVQRKDTHRPILRKEFRLLARRAANYLTTYSGRLFEGYVLKGLDNMVTKDTSLQHGGLTFDNLKVNRK